MNKKGVEMIKMTFFIIGSLIVGALVIFAFPNMVNKLMTNTQEQIIAKDLGLTIMTISGSPNDVVYRYDQSTENYEVRIDQNEVRVNSKGGSGKYKYIQMTGISIEDALIKNALTIPMTLKNGKLSFSDDKITYSDVCSVIPSEFDKEKIKVKVDVSAGEIYQSAQKLEEIKSLMKMYATQANSKIEFVDSHEDLLLNLQTGAGLEIKYYEDIENQNLPWYHRAACYINNGLNSEENLKSAAGAPVLSQSSEKSITISFGDANKFIDALNNDAQLSLRVSNEIYTAIELGISD